MTADHIPAKCLFAKPRPSDLITVPACADCHDTGPDDEYLRNMLGISHFAQHHRYFDSLNAASLRAFERHGEQRRHLIDALRTFKLGAYNVVAPVYDPEMARLDRTLARYARGLHRWKYGEIVPPDGAERVFPLWLKPWEYHEQPRKVMARVVPIVLGTEETSRGEDAFRFWSANVADAGSLWIIGLFGAFWLVVLAKESSS